MAFLRYVLPCALHPVNPGASACLAAACGESVSDESVDHFLEDRSPLQLAAGGDNRRAHKHARNRDDTTTDHACAACERRCRKKEICFFGQPGGSAVQSMQGTCARSRHDLTDPGSASPADALLWGRFLFDPCKGMHTHSRRSRTALGWGTARRCSHQTPHVPGAACDNTAPAGKEFSQELSISGEDPKRRTPANKTSFAGV
jgi:hypothetical protein